MSTSDSEQRDDLDTFKVPRRIFLALFLFSLTGTGAELVLLEHFEGYWQKVPLILMVASLIVLGGHVILRRSKSVRAFQAMMILLVVSGGAGLILHYRGNVEFELEMHPGAAGLELVINALMGATPALAPGAMMQIGLLGLAYTYRHPALSGSRLAKIEAEKTEEKK